MDIILFLYTFDLIQIKGKSLPGWIDARQLSLSLSLSLDVGSIGLPAELGGGASAGSMV